MSTDRTSQEIREMKILPADLSELYDKVMEHPITKTKFTVTKIDFRTFAENQILQYSRTTPEPEIRLEGYYCTDEDEIILDAYKLGGCTLDVCLSRLSDGGLWEVISGMFCDKWR